MAALTGKQRMDQSFDANLRMNHVVDIASLMGAEELEGSVHRLDGPAEDLIEWLLDDGYKKHPSIEPLRKIVVKAIGDEADDQSLESLHEDLYAAAVYRGEDMLGLAVQFSTPVMERISKTSWGFSWGYTISTWIYAPTYDEAWKLGVAWAEKNRADAKPPKKSPAKRKAKASA